MTDRELLELAAKAAGIGITSFLGGKERYVYPTDWNPLTDDGDALRLAVKLRLHVDHHHLSGVSAWVLSWASNSGNAEPYDEDTGDDSADTRRAIVRAAAAMAKENTL